MSGYSEEDMIVAPATPANVRAPIAILRISGGDCHKHLDQWFQARGRSTMKPWKARYGHWVDDQGVIDDVMAITYRAPQSYTGQDMVEVFCHGNPLFIEAIIATVLAAGGRRARPGEFTMRAVLNGKMDLLTAEAVHGLIESHTRYQADLIRRQHEGPLVEFIKEQVERILQIQAHIEATIDYGEEDIDALERDELAGKLQTVIEELAQVHQTAAFVKGMQRGFKVLLVGEPNVGKSTLFNTLVRQERAIVTDLPGTTRDVISEAIEMDGLPIQVLDSAGMRESQDRIEVLGIEKIRTLIHEVDLVLCLRTKDGGAQLLPIIDDIPDNKRLDVITKADLPGPNPDQQLCVSAQDGQGIEDLEQEIVLRLSTALAGQPIYLINQRQEETLFAVIEDLQQAHQDYQAGHGEEVLSAYLNAARRRLGELTGETTVEDILDRMFSNFCLGK